MVIHIIPLVVICDVMFKDLLKIYHCSSKIRIGPKGDGGYVVDGMNLSKELISVGCNNETEFESDYLKLLPSTQIKIYDRGGRCDLATTDQRVTFIKKHVTSIEDLEINDGCMVAMDIEGYEIDLIRKSDTKFLKKIKQLLIEFHFWNDPEEHVVCDVFSKLNQVFVPIHIHANNYKRFFYKDTLPQVIEVTYVNKVECNYTTLETSKFPMPNLDFPNNPKLEDTPLPWVNN